MATTFSNTKYTDIVANLLKFAFTLSLADNPASWVAEVRTHKVTDGRMSGSVTSLRKRNRTRITNWRHTEMFSIRTRTHISVSDDLTTADEINTPRHDGVVIHTQITYLV